MNTPSWLASAAVIGGTDHPLALLLLLHHLLHLILLLSLLLSLLRHTGAEPGALEWNYVKFLVDREGQAIARYKPAFTDFEADVSDRLFWFLRGGGRALKFLVNREGQAIARYKPAFTDFEADVSASF
jgi:glutathione peroxidase-family protein